YGAAHEQDGANKKQFGVPDEYESGVSSCQLLVTSCQYKMAACSWVKPIIRGAGRGSKTLSRTHCLAKSDGLGDLGLQGHQRLPTGRNVRTDPAGSTGRCLDTLQHRRGTGPRIGQRLSTLPCGGPWLASGG